MGIDDESHIRNYELQQKIFSMFKDILSGYSDYNLIILFLKIAKNYLRFEYECTTSKRKEVIFCRVPLIYNKGSEAYRTILWEQLLNIYDIDLYKIFVDEILKGYYVHRDCSDDIVMKVDKPHLEQLLIKMNHENFQNILIIDKLNTAFIDRGNQLEGVDKFINNNIYLLYKTLKRDYREIEDEAKKKRQDNIKRYINNYSLEDYSIMFQQMKIISENINSDYEL